jgi:3-polyprenyl-4-hydroxybenzoate decarboxylase
MPGTVKSLVGTACVYADSLTLGAAGVTIKDRCPQVRVCRETPLFSPELGCTIALFNMGLLILLFSPSFVLSVTQVQNMIEKSVAGVLDALHIVHSLCSPLDRGSYEDSWALNSRSDGSTVLTRASCLS